MYMLDILENSIIESVADGDGYRLVLFLSGCTHQCKNCHNEHSWNMRNGKEYNVLEVFRYLDKQLSNGLIDGVTVSGGDPMLQSEEVMTLIRLIKGKYPKVNIWLYTGFLYEEIKERPIVKLLDVIVDGKFEVDKQHPKKKYRGSYNQRILYLKNGLIENEV